MSERLKPCPFCNGQAKIGIKRESAGMDGSYVNWIIHCEKCGAMITYPADRFYGRKALTEDEAIEAWNRRDGEKRKEPEIIHCTECKHYREYDSKYVKNAVVVQCMADRYPISEIIPDGWFCAGAERRTE